MKKRNLLIALIGLSLGIKAQNTIPTNGNVGIGTSSPKESLHLEGNLLIDAFGKGNESGIFFRENFSFSNKYNLSILAFDHNGSSPDGFSFNAYDGISFSTGSNTRNERMRININGNVGIGTTNPSNRLHVSGNSGIRVSGEGIDQIFIEGVRIGSGANFRLYDNNNNIYYDSKTNMTFRANQLGGSDGSINLTGGNVGIGTHNPGSWKLAVNGKIRAKEIKVETGWSDFVFEDEYKLPTLKEVENHIKEKGHLKDIPSAKEVEKNGIFLGEMDAKLLQKIEELTLYTIQQEKEIVDLNKLKSKVKTLEKENKSLKTMNSKLIELQKRIEKLEKK